MTEEPDKQHSAIDAFEIPGLSTELLRRENPELLEQLNKNACITVVVEYDLIPEKTREPRGTYTVQQSTGGSSDWKNQSEAGGISQWSELRQGSHVTDRSRKVEEKGLRKLISINVYAMDIMVINTRGQTLTPLQAEQAVQLMKSRAQLLNELYLPYKTMTLDNLCLTLVDYSRKYNDHSHYQDTFIKTLWRLVNLEIPVVNGQLNKIPGDQKHFNLHLTTDHETSDTLIQALTAQFGSEFCIPTPSQSTTTQTIQFSLSAIARNFSVFEQCLNEILSEQPQLASCSEVIETEEEQGPGMRFM